MDKLLNLLNKYKGGGFTYSPFGNFIRGEYDSFESVIPAEIISKKFGFIKWLVENEKIDLNRIPQKFEGYYDDKREYIYGEESILLMKLAMSDTPIEDLISYLK